MLHIIKCFSTQKHISCCEEKRCKVGVGFCGGGVGLYRYVLLLYIPLGKGGGEERYVK